MEEKIAHRLLFTIQWKTLVGGARRIWGILTLSNVRFDITDGIAMALCACRPRMNVHSARNVGSFCTCATACFTRRQCCRLNDQVIIHQFSSYFLELFIYSISQISQTLCACSCHV
jgi:hypothetical protein